MAYFGTTTQVSVKLAATSMPTRAPNESTTKQGWDSGLTEESGVEQTLMAS
jgi:hypothetical protein